MRFFINLTSRSLACVVALPYRRLRQVGWICAGAVCSVEVALAGQWVRLAFRSTTGAKWRWFELVDWAKTVAFCCLQAQLLEREVVVEQQVERAEKMAEGYSIICSLGRGSYGAIYKARRAVDNSICVLKQVCGWSGVVCTQVIDECESSCLARFHWTDSRSRNSMKPSMKRGL